MCVYIYIKVAVESAMLSQWNYEALGLSGKITIKETEVLAVCSAEPVM